MHRKIRGTSRQNDRSLAGEGLEPCESSHMAESGARALLHRPLAFTLVAALALLGACGRGPARSGVSARRAAVAATQLQRDYRAHSGLFCPRSSNCWWWTANDLTALADYGQRAHTPAYLPDFATTFRRAAALGPARGRIGPFLDTWNDDDGWWGLAWLAAYRYARPYDRAQAARYLALSEAIFRHVSGQWNTSVCGGGLWQNANPTHTKDAIANELFLSLSAQLSLATGRSSYLRWANREWTWFQAAGFIGPNHLVYDHLQANCAPRGTQYWLANQGALLGGLAAVYQAERTADPAAARTALAQAEGVAGCVTSAACGGNPQVAQPTLRSAGGILTEACKTSPCTYAPAWVGKGVFVRNLAALNGLTGRYRTYLAHNAASLWAQDRGTSGQFGFYWSNPPAFYLPAGGSAPVLGEALDLLVTQLRG